MQEWVSPEQLQEKLGWLNEFATPIAEWSEWQQVVNITVEFIDRQGMYSGASQDLGAKLPRAYQYCSSADLATELVTFVAEQAKQAKEGERFPGSTEVLESCFGKM